MKQAPLFECFSFDPFSSLDDGCCSAEVGVGRCHVVEALVVALVVVMLDEGLDLALQIAGQEVVLQQNTVLECLVPAFDLALRLRMERCASHMIHAVLAKIVGQFLSDVAGALSDSRRGLCLTLAWSQPEAASAISSVSVTSSAFIVMHSFQAMM